MRVVIFRGRVSIGHCFLGGVLISKGCSEDYLYFFSFLYFRYIYSCTWVLWLFLTYIVLIFFIYVDVYFSFTYPLHVLFLFSLYAHASYFLYAIYYFCFTKRCLDEFCLKCFRNTGCQSLLAINSLLAKFFKSLCYDRFYYIQQVSMS